MLLREFCSGNVVTIQSGDAIDEAIRLLEEHQIRHLPVVREGVAIGMVSQGDILANVGGLLSEDRVPTQDPTISYAGPTTVEQIMTTHVSALLPEDSLVEAAQLMLDRQIATVVVVENETIVGIVSELDYLRRLFDGSSVIPDACAQQQVADHMATDLVTTSPDKNVFSLLREMARKIHHLPVVKDGKLVGILSDHDVWRAMALDKVEKIKNPSHEHIRLVEDCDAGRIMHRDVVTTTPDTTLAEAARLMIEHKVGCTPVVEAEKLVGMITESDILRACAAEMAR